MDILKGYLRDGYSIVIKYELNGGVHIEWVSNLEFMERLIRFIEAEKGGIIKGLQLIGR